MWTFLFHLHLKLSLLMAAYPYSVALQSSFDIWLWHGCGGHCDFSFLSRSLLEQVLFFLLLAACSRMLLLKMGGLSSYFVLLLFR